MCRSFVTGELGGCASALQITMTLVLQACLLALQMHYVAQWEVDEPLLQFHPSEFPCDACRDSMFKWLWNWLQTAAGKSALWQPGCAHYSWMKLVSVRTMFWFMPFPLCVWHTATTSLEKLYTCLLISDFLNRTISVLTCMVQAL